MHKLLKRQIQKTGAIVDEKFLELVNQAYIDADEDRTLLELSLEISSKEMRELYETLQKHSKLALKQSEEKYNKLVYELRHHYIFYAFNQEFQLTDVTDSVYNILGYTKESLINKNFTSILTNDDINAKSIHLAQKTLEGEESEPHILCVTHYNGNPYYFEVSIYPVYDKEHKFLEVRGIARNITTEYIAHKKIHYISNHDNLTGIANRYNLENKLEYILSDAQRNHKNFSIFYLDLDGFKNVNDTYGHSVGDILLQEVVKRVQNEIRQNDVFARIGGDEFVLVLTNIDKTYISYISNKILKSLNQKFYISGQTIIISASIGIASYPKNGEDIETLLKNADQAMYSIKASGKNDFLNL